MFETRSRGTIGYIKVTGKNTNPVNHPYSATGARHMDILPKTATETQFVLNAPDPTRNAQNPPTLYSPVQTAKAA